MYLIEIPKLILESLLTQAKNLIDITISQPTDRTKYDAVMASISNNIDYIDKKNK